MADRCAGCMRIKTQGRICEHCGFDEANQNTPGQLPIGTILRGQYLIGKALGQGGFGITYLGWDLALEMPVAIKEHFPQAYVERANARSKTVIPRTGRVGELFQQTRERFLQEGRTLAKLKDMPQIVHVHSLFEENNTAYLVMEYLQGVDLRHHLQKRGKPLTVQETLYVMRPVLEALIKVHETGLVHRDISPDNIMLQSDGSTKLLDFGSAREVTDPNAEKEMSRSTEAILKHGFAPMEQYQRRGSLGPWTDVYALCATIFYCLTGRIPPEAPDRIINNAPMNWRMIPGLSPQQTAVLEKGMALLPKDRIGSVEELYRGLYVPGAVVIPNHGSDSANGGGNYGTAGGGNTVDKKQLTILLAVTAVVLSAVLLFLLARPSEEDGGKEHIHTWNPASCTQPKTCAECGETQGVAMGHSWMEATYDHPKTCSICGMEEGSALEPVSTPTGMVAAGNYHSVYLSPEGTVVAAGRKLPGSGENRGTRLDVSGWSDIVAISAASHTLGLKSDGTVMAVGVNTSGQCNVDRWKDIIAVDAGDNHSVGLKSDGTVVAVGDNSKGQCNVGSWENIVQVAAGEKTTYALTEDGRVLSAGEKNYGSDWRDITAICAGTYHLVGLKSDGTVVQMGSCDSWDGNTSGWYDIVAISAGSIHTVGLRSDGTVVACGSKQAKTGQLKVGSWYDIVSIGAGMYHTVGLKSDGTIVAVGDNTNQQLNITAYS